MTVMMALTWWGKASRTSKEWKTAVREVVVVLSCVIQSRSQYVNAIVIVAHDC